MRVHYALLENICTIVRRSPTLRIRVGLNSARIRIRHADVASMGETALDRGMPPYVVAGAGFALAVDGVFGSVSPPAANHAAASLGEVESLIG